MTPRRTGACGVSVICHFAALLLIPLSSPPRVLEDGLTTIARTEGVRGLWRGTSLALFGVTNGAIQFMAYEKMKDWAFGVKRKRYAQTGQPWTANDDKLVRVSALSREGHRFDGRVRSLTRRTLRCPGRASWAR